MLSLGALLLVTLNSKLEVLSAKPAPEIDALFQRSDGWIGGDGAYSVLLPGGRVAWLFSDTWIGKVRDGKRTDATIVNNTIGIQKSRLAPLDYAVAGDSAGKPRAQIVPEDGHGWFWQQAAGFANGKLYRFLNQVEKSGDPGVFGFRSVGLWLGVTAGVDGEPAAWHTRQIKLSNTLFEPTRTLVWGSSVLIQGETAYIYGTDEHRGDRGGQRHMVVARVPAAKLEDTAAWEYFDGKAWSKDFRMAAHLAQFLATEHSVTRFGPGYLAVYTLDGLSSKIVARYAEQPWGPWSESTTLYTCPEIAANPKAFTYAAKAHESLSRGDEVVLSYVANSTDFWEVARNARLYWPRFVRVKLRIR
ncbi:MAG: DUF4185 domain-containing protein [Fimbriimonadales bacterium]